MRGDEERPGEPCGVGRGGGLDAVAGELAAAIVVELDLPLHRDPLTHTLRRAMIAEVTTTAAEARSVYARYRVYSASHMSFRPASFKDIQRTGPPTTTDGAEWMIRLSAVPSAE